MKMKKSIAFVLSMLTAFSMTACGGEENSTNPWGKFEPHPDAQVVEIVSMNGGVGNDWLKALEPQIEEYYSTKMYGTRPGIDIEIVEKQGVATDAMGSETYDIYFAERADVQTFIKKGLLLNINDLVTKEDANARSIASAMDENVRERFIGADGNYYGIPHYQFYGGFSYDAETFANYDAYFADSSNDSQWTFEYESQYGNALFLTNVAGKKSCGPDGEFGTYDDGLPTSLQEMLILCSYLKENNVAPIVLSGQYKNMSNYLICGLWASLAGFDSMSTIYTFEGEIEAIKLDANGDYVFTDELLFEGVEGIYKPETEKVFVTLENGYRTTDMVEKYYALAFMEACYKESFFDTDSLLGTVSHTGAQRNIIFGSENSGAKDCGMLIDGSYWWNESVLANNFIDYQDYTDSTEEREIRWMSMPTSLNTTTTEGNGEVVTLLDIGQGATYVNKNVETDKEAATLIPAIKDVLEFAYSDQALRDFTRITGVSRPFNYTLTTAEKNSMSGYSQAIAEMKEVGRTVAFAGGNEVFNTYSTTFRVNLECEALTIKFDGATYKGVYNAMEKGCTAKDAIKATRIGATQWTGFYTPSND